MRPSWGGQDTVTLPTPAPHTNWVPSSRIWRARSPNWNSSSSTCCRRASRKVCSCSASFLQINNRKYGSVFHGSSQNVGRSFDSSYKRMSPSLFVSVSDIGLLLGQVFFLFLSLSFVFYIELLLIFFLNLLQNNLHTMKFTYFKSTSQWFLVNLLGCVTIAMHFWNTSFSPTTLTPLCSESLFLPLNFKQLLIHFWTHTLNLCENNADFWNSNKPWHLHLMSPTPSSQLQLTFWPQTPRLKQWCYYLANGSGKLPLRKQEQEHESKGNAGQFLSSPAPQCSALLPWLPFLAPGRWAATYFYGSLG